MDVVCKSIGAQARGWGSPDAAMSPPYSYPSGNIYWGYGYSVFIPPYVYILNSSRVSMDYDG